MRAAYSKVGGYVEIGCSYTTYWPGSVKLGFVGSDTETKDAETNCSTGYYWCCLTF